MGERTYGMPKKNTKKYTKEMIVTIMKRKSLSFNLVFISYEKKYTR